MAKTKYISAAQAAKMTDVTTQTIRNLCKSGVLSYQKRTNLFYPSREDVERYKAAIADIHAATQDIEQYKHQLETERDTLKAELCATQAKYRERMYNLEMFPKRIEVIRDTLLAVMEGVSHYVDERDCCVTPRELSAVWDALQGKSFEEIGNDMRPFVTKESARQIWAKGLRKFAHVKGAFYRLNSENDQLKEELQEKNDEIANLHAQIEGRQPVITDEKRRLSKILAMSVNDCDITVRVLNCLRYADVETVRDLVKMHRADLLKYRNFGKKSLTELDEFLEDRGLAWGMDVSDIPEYVA